MRHGASYLLFCAVAACAAHAQAGLRPLLPGEQVVYQTVQAGTNYRTFFTQITGNAYTNYGDEIILGGNCLLDSVEHVGNPALLVEGREGKQYSLYIVFVQLGNWSVI